MAFGRRLSRHAGAASLDVTEGTIWKQLLLLCVPIFFSSFFQQAHALINTFILGQFGGKLALGGVQATASLFELAVGFSVGLGAGCAVISGQFFGSHDDERLSRSIHTAMTIALVLGLAVSVAGVIFVPHILTIMGTPADLMGEAVPYSRFYAAAMVCSLVLNMGSALLRSVGDTRTPALIIASGCLINACLDILFVAVLGLEAMGCGMATAITLTINAATMTIRLMRAKGAWRLDIRRLGVDGRICRSMLATGLPLGIQSSLYSISNIILQSTVNTFGTNAVTGWGLSGRLDAFIWMVTEALGVSMTTFSAQNFGARNYERMRRGYHTSLIITVCIIGGMSALLVAFVGPLSRIFIDDAAVTGYTTLMLHFIAPFYLFYSIVDNTSGAIRGSGESLRPMLLTVLGTVVFRVIWLLAVVPLHHTIETMLMVYPVTWILTAILFVAYHHWGHWLNHAEARAEKLNHGVV
ncbi:MATE family efflux transporter [Collinsella tanakaei]|uniref:MATE family efflux transporter n=1 Tax=Collinsella tanakaei TaxID=626935 RepID=UPI00195CC37F|nr:MATE family efflux transporter [Collinsella tanakaei]MBM6756350.1 MATE family efflux transporter [Collinsella tanakaei]